MPTMDEFLRTGRLGEVAVGRDREAIRALLGEPGATSRQKNTEIWKYGSLQLGFSRGPQVEEPVLTTINLFFHDSASSIPDRLGLTGWRPSRGATVEEFGGYIRGFDPAGYGVAPSFGPFRVTLDSGVQVTFDEGQLYGIHYHSKREPEGKQLTIFVPNDVLDVLRREATEQRISVSSLCTRWIQEHAASRTSTGDD